MPPEIWVALIGGVFALFLEFIRRQNKRDHLKGYGLLESIDKRTMRMDDKLDEHGERLAVVEERVERLDP